MKNYLETAKKLIQERTNAERWVDSIKTELIAKEKGIEVQQRLAEKGLNNILAFEIAQKVKIELKLIEAQTELDKINTEIETHKLAADLNRSHDLNISNQPEKVYYSDKDFNQLIDELLEKEMFEITDFLEFKFSQIFVSNSMSRFNWLTSFRKNLLWRFPSRNDGEKELRKVPAQIDIAYSWEHNKNATLIRESQKKFVENAEIPEAKYALPSIALGYQYLREVKLHVGINEVNRDEIAAKYQWKAKSSGRKLHDYYKKFHTESDRITPRFSDSLVSKQSTIKNMENAIALLTTIPQSEKAVLKAKKELQKIQQS